MKVLLCADVVFPNAQGGAGMVAWQEAQALKAAGHDVSFYTSHQEGTEDKEWVEQGIHVYSVATIYHERWRAYLGLYNPPAMRMFKKVLAKEQPELVHFHNIHQYLSLALIKIAKRHGIKTVLTAHDVMLFHLGKLVEFIDPRVPVCKSAWDYRVSAWQQVRRFKKRYNPLRRTIIRKMLTRLDALVAVSNSVADALAQNGIGGARVLYNSIDVSAWQESPADTQAFAAKYSLAGKKVVLFGGRLTPMKGSAVLLDAFAQVAAQEPDAVLVVASKHDAYVESLLRDAGVRGIKDRIVPTGWLERAELVAAFHAAQVVVVPSLCFESFSLMVLQGMAAGKPVVASCFGGPTELVVQGESGYLVNPYDTKLLADKLGSLLADRELCRRMGEVGRARAWSLFNLPVHLESVQNLYRSV